MPGQMYGVISGKLSGVGQVRGTLTIPEVAGAEYYDGPYEFTPTQEEQQIETAGLMMIENVIINPIPNNYGLITWNGSVLTVS